MQAILEREPRLPSQVATPARARQLRGDLDSILMKSLQKEAVDRCASVARFSEDVTDYLAQAREVLGDSHPGTLRSMHNLADVYRGLGRRAESRDLFHKVLERRRESLGGTHPTTLIAAQEMVDLLQGNLASYEQLMRRAITLADSHPQVSVPGFAESRHAFLELSDRAGASVPDARVSAETH